MESLAILGGLVVRIAPLTPWPLYSDKEETQLGAIHKVLANIESLRDLNHPAIHKQHPSRADRES
jgi:hypothetical protein